MPRRPPSSPLFPYTTLFRSKEREAREPEPSDVKEPLGASWSEFWRTDNGKLERDSGDSTVLRSEEHTSELQSPCNLVCRLLLEKKKKTTRAKTTTTANI